MTARCFVEEVEGRYEGSESCEGVDFESRRDHVHEKLSVLEMQV